MIWYNNQIKVGDKCVYYKYWLSAGVYFIGDHLDDNGCFLSLNDFRFKVRTNFIEYGAILRAIKVAFKNNNNIPFPLLPYFQVLLSDKTCSRRLYDIFILSKKVVRKFVDNWERKLQINYDSTKWYQVFSVPFTCTVECKLKWFQFRLTHMTLFGHKLFCIQN